MLFGFDCEPLRRTIAEEFVCDSTLTGLLLCASPFARFHRLRIDHCTKIESVASVNLQSALYRIAGLPSIDLGSPKLQSC
jgi:hypothetical protein